MATTIAADARPRIVSRDAWVRARKDLLAREKEAMRAMDRLSAQRRRLPMVRVEKAYTFDGPAIGDRRTAMLRDLFDGRRQLIVYHFMFDPADPPAGKTSPWSEGCPGCSYLTDNIPHLAHLRARDTNLVLVSRARPEKIAPFQRRMGWSVPWYSSFGSDFNHDFHVTLDESVAPVEYNYDDRATLESKQGGKAPTGEMPGLSVFLRSGEEVFHAYSTYGRGLEAIVTTYHLLDLTPYGRQEEWEDSPAGWPRTQGAMGWVRHHDTYEAQPKTAGCCH